MSNAMYDKLKTISLLVAPAVVFMTALVDIWGIPYGQQLVATLAAIDVMFGTIVTILAAQYKKSLGGENNG